LCIRKRELLIKPKCKYILLIGDITKKIKTIAIVTGIVFSNYSNYSIFGKTGTVLLTVLFHVALFIKGRLPFMEAP